MGEVPGTYIAAALVPAILITILFYFDHSVSSQLAQVLALIPYKLIGLIDRTCCCINQFDRTARSPVDPIHSCYPHHHLVIF